MSLDTILFQEPKTQTLDAFELRIQEEVEEFLRDLTLEFPFPEVFESLRRHEFKGRYGANVTPFPRKPCAEDTLKQIKERVDYFLGDLESLYGKNYAIFIQNTFRHYTITTVE